jgi:hypothetical protein
MFEVVEPPHSYVRAASASLVHHADYLDHRDGQSLCGVVLVDVAVVSESPGADVTCPDCEAKLVTYHLEWWREKALAATAELEVLRATYEPADTDVAAVAPAAVADSAAESALAEGATFLDRARRELTQLSRQFEGAVPFYRLNNTMQDFSEKLNDDERARLAQEIGPDSSLIRWATMEVESRGLSVTNNRVQENSDMMWQDWLEESQQAAPKTKKRFGRSR